MKRVFIIILLLSLSNAKYDPAKLKEKYCPIEKSKCEGRLHVACSGFKEGPVPVDPKLYGPEVFILYFSLNNVPIRTSFPLLRM